jgi:hypothetical protein
MPSSCPWIQARGRREDIIFGLNLSIFLGQFLTSNQLERNRIMANLVDRKVWPKPFKGYIPRPELWQCEDCCEILAKEEVADGACPDCLSTQIFKVVEGK